MRLFRFLILGICFSLFASLTTSAENKSGVKPQVLSLPSGPGSIEGLGAAFEPQLNTGGSSYSVNLEVPPGINGQQPSLTLSYNSGGGNGPFGLGWDLSAPSIERQLKDGIPKYDDSDKFTYNGNELVPLVDGSWAPRNAGGFMRFRRVGDTWEGKDKSGNYYRFGLYPNTNPLRQSRVGHKDLSFDNTYRWLLNEQIDVDGNRTEFFYATYDESPGQVYLTEIRYNIHENLYHSVEFYYEKRPDLFTDYRTGFKVQTAYRASKIRMLTAGKQVREYRLEYELKNSDYITTPSEAGIDLNFSRLAKVTQYDRTGENHLPPLRLEYTKLYTEDADLYPFGNFPGEEDIDLNGNGLQDKAPIQSMVETPSNLNFLNSTTEFLDVNGDGLPDLYNTKGGIHQYALNMGENRFADWQTMKNAPIIELSNPNVTLADLDGDGLTDLIHKTGSNQWKYYRNRGDGSFAPAVVDERPPAFEITGPDTRFIDINFDNKIDIVRTNPNGTWSYCLSQKGADTDHFPFDNFPGPEDVDENGDGKIDATSWNCVGSVKTEGLYADSIFQNSTIRTADMNGDRMQDLVWIRPDGTKLKIGYFPSQGLANFDQFLSMENAPEVGSVDPNTLKLNDLNGDGLTDLIKVRPGSVTIWFNLANNSWSEPYQYDNTVYYQPATTSIRFADMNGNGTADLVWIQQAPANPEERIQYLDFSGRVKANQLRVIDNGIGRRTEIRYRSTVESMLNARKDGNPWSQHTPFPMQVVAQTITYSGLDLDTIAGDDSYVTDFAYRDSWYDPYQKEFRGFAFVKKIEWGDETAPTQLTRIFFHTGAPDGVDNDGDGRIDERAEDGETEELPLKGQILQQEVTTADGGVHSAQNDGKLSLDSHVFQRLENKWGIRRIHDIAGGAQGVATINNQEVSFSYHIEEKLHLIELGLGERKTLRKTFKSDAYGNALEEKVYGAEEIEGDEVFSFQSYIYDTERWIVGKVHTSLQTDAAGNRVSESRVYYDGEPYVGLELGQLEKGKPTRKQSWVSGETFIDIERKAYDSYGNLIGSKDGNGNLRSFEYDPRFHTWPIKETIHLGPSGTDLIVTAKYDEALGKVVESTDFNGHTGYYRYDTFGRLITIIQPGDSFDYPTQKFEYRPVDPHRALSYRYDNSGSLTLVYTSERISTIRTESREVSGRAGVLEAWKFSDGLGRELGALAEDNDGYIFSGGKLFNRRGGALYTFQPKRQPDLTFHKPSWVDPHSETRYDETGRPILSIQPPDSDGVQHQTTTEFRPLNKAVIDANDNRKEIFQDGREKVLKVHEYNKGETYVTQYRYDTPGNLIQITDAQDNIKRITYDGLGRKTWMNDPDKGESQYFYDNVGNLIRTIDNKGDEVKYSYDTVNRPIHEDFTGKAGIEVEYQYDVPTTAYVEAKNLRGKLVSVRDDSGVSYFSYDERGNINWNVKRIIDGGRVDNYRLSMTYDAMGRLTSLTWPDGESVKYDYDQRGSLKKIPGVIDSILYEPGGQVTSMEFVNGVTTQYGYDKRLRMVALESGYRARPSFQQLSYQFDGVGNILSITDGRNLPDNDPGIATQNFAYDNLYRLTQAKGVYGTIGFDYDKIGNKILKNSPKTGDPGHIADELINLGAMAYGSVAGSSGRDGKGAHPGPHAITSTESGMKYDYDANGNMTLHAKGDQYEWDYKNRLVKLTKDGKETRYIYDFSGQRVIKHVEPGTQDEKKSYYIGETYEVRGDKSYKFISAGSRRVARIEGPIQIASTRIQTLNLKSGWNFVTLTVEPDNASPESVFASILPSIDEIYAWDAQLGDYRYFRKGEFSNLMDIRPYSGLLIKTNQATNLDIEGRHLTVPIELNQGWNLIALPLDKAESPEVALKELEGQYESIHGYDATGDQWLTHFADSALPKGLNTLKELQPATAYWLKMKTASSLNQGGPMSGIKTFYHPDHLGSTNFVTNETGAITEKIEYYPFGSPRYRETLEGTASFYQYTGKELDKESGLYYYEARYMDSIIGRFISVDPLFVEASDECDVQQCNLYSYTSNNPLIYIDPSGMFEIKIEGKQGVGGSINYKNVGVGLDLGSENITLLHYKSPNADSKTSRSLNKKLVKKDEGFIDGDDYVSQGVTIGWGVGVAGVERKQKGSPWETRKNIFQMLKGAPLEGTLGFSKHNIGQNVAATKTDKSKTRAEHGWELLGKQSFGIQLIFGIKIEVDFSSELKSFHKSFDAAVGAAMENYRRRHH